MSGTRPRFVAALTLAALAAFAVGGSPVSAAAPHVLMVDADGHAGDGNCGAANSAFSTIESAIGASHAGDTVKVCPGDYTENLTIHANRDNLTIISTSPWKARIHRPTSLTGDTPLVYIRPGADGVTLRHFSLIFDTTNDCDKSTAEAILVSGNHDQVLGNRIRTTGPDTDFATCGYFIGVGVGLQSGPTTSTSSVASLASIAPAGSPPISATIGWNTVRDFQFGGVIVVGPQTTATTKRNSIHYGHQGASSCTMPVTAAASLPGPRSRGAITPSGIVTCLSIGIIYSDLAGGRIHDNVVMSDFELVGTTSPSGTSQPLLYGGILNGFLGSGGSVNITDNTVQFAVAGIGSGPNTGPVLIAGNTVSFTLDFGIGLIGGSTSTAVKQNKVAQSGGLFAADTAIGNIFRSNTVTNGGCEDDTIGVDTGGTANHWVNDIGDTSSPVGICTPAP